MLKSESRSFVISSCHEALRDALVEMASYPRAKDQEIYQQAESSLTWYKEDRLTISRHLIRVLEFIDEARSKCEISDIAHMWEKRTSGSIQCAQCTAVSSLSWGSQPQKGCCAVEPMSGWGHKRRPGKMNFVGVFYREEQPPSDTDIDWKKWYSIHFCCFETKIIVADSKWLSILEGVKGPGQWMFIHCKPDRSLYFERGRFLVSFYVQYSAVIVDGRIEHRKIPEPREGATLCLVVLTPEGNIVSFDRELLLSINRIVPPRGE